MQDEALQYEQPHERVGDSCAIGGWTRALPSLTAYVLPEQPVRGSSVSTDTPKPRVAKNRATSGVQRDLCD